MELTVTKRVVPGGGTVRITIGGDSRDCTALLRRYPFLAGSNGQVPKPSNGSSASKGAVVVSFTPSPLLKGGGPDKLGRIPHWLKRRRKNNSKNKQECTCQFCGKKFLRNRIRKHEDVCCRNPMNRTRQQELEFDYGIQPVVTKHTCAYCGLACWEKYVGAHEAVCQLNPQVQLVNALAIDG